ncbi:MAG: GNAT family N-acetyltransferase [Gammaproteobacteria bacterium]|nr:GNAT family N-acetyltransferase [Gammaproteobacteria bacterium]
MTESFKIKHLEPTEYQAVCTLGNWVHGEGYLSKQTLHEMHKKSLYKDLNASYVMYDGDVLIGFRISYAPGCWPLDKWCTPNLWGVDQSEVAYFKCNTIHPDYQGRGLGGQLLKQSITTLKSMGAKAGLSHIWMQSPGNASFKYFTKAGGKLIKTHARRWYHDDSLPDYICILCGEDCYCDASEMLLQF